MDRQLVEVAILNRILDLHEHTPIVTTLGHIADLVSFQRQHALCNNIIFNLRDQLATIKA